MMLAKVVVRCFLEMVVEVVGVEFHDLGEGVEGGILEMEEVEEHTPKAVVGEMVVC